MLWPLAVHTGKRRTERRTERCLILSQGITTSRPFDRLELCLLTILSQYCSAMAAIHDATMRTNDDPIILDVEADGDGPARNTNAGPLVIPPSTWPGQSAYHP